ncbi:MAG: hypothetical protein V1926_02960 [Candidatus Peregrinibacteria bacterium]
MPSRASSRFTPLLFWGTIVLIALVMASLSLWKTLTPLRGQVQPPPPQVIDHHSPRPSFKLFGPWYRTKNFDFTRARWTSKAQYNFSNIQPGVYKIEASYLPYALFAQAPYTIKEGENILAEASIDQSAGAAPGTRPTEQWVQIATDLTINGPDLTVEMTSPATPGATASVMARGVRLTMLSPSSSSSSSATRPVVIRFMLDPALVDTSISDVGQRLSRYVEDINKIYAKTTVRRFVFDPNVHVKIWDKPFPTGGGCYPLKSGYEYHVFVQKSPKDFSYNGTSLCNIFDNNALVTASYKWEKIWDDNDIGTDEEARDDYYRRQLRAVIHELGHSHGLGLGEYYSLATLSDDTGIEPDLSVRLTNPDDRYWSSRKKVFNDPMFGMPPLETFMADMQFSPMSSKMINMTALDSDLTLCDNANLLLCDVFEVRSGTQVPIQVIDEQTGQPVSGCSLKIFKVDAGSSKYELMDAPEIGTDATYNYIWQGEGATTSLHASTNLVRLVKAACPGYMPGGEWISVFDLQAAKVMPNGGDDDDFHFNGVLTIEVSKQVQAQQPLTLSANVGSHLSIWTDYTINFQITPDSAEGVGTGNATNGVIVNNVRYQKFDFTHEEGVGWSVLKVFAELAGDSVKSRPLSITFYYFMRDGEVIPVMKSYFAGHTFDVFTVNTGSAAWKSALRLFTRGPAYMTYEDFRNLQAGSLQSGSERAFGEYLALADFTTNLIDRMMDHLEAVPGYTFPNGINPFSMVDDVDSSLPRSAKERWTLRAERIWDTLSKETQRYLYHFCATGNGNSLNAIARIVDRDLDAVKNGTIEEKAILFMAIMEPVRKVLLHLDVSAELKSAIADKMFDLVMQKVQQGRIQEVGGFVFLTHVLLPARTTNFDVVRYKGQIQEMLNVAIARNKSLAQAYLFGFTRETFSMLHEYLPENGDPLIAEYADNLLKNPGALTNENKAFLAWSLQYGISNQSRSSIEDMLVTEDLSNLNTSFTKYLRNGFFFSDKTKERIFIERFIGALTREIDEGFAPNSQIISDYRLFSLELLMNSMKKDGIFEEYKDLLRVFVPLTNPQTENESTDAYRVRIAENEELLIRYGVLLCDLGGARVQGPLRRQNGKPGYLDMVMSFLTTYPNYGVNIFVLWENNTRSTSRDGMPFISVPRAVHREDFQAVTIHETSHPFFDASANSNKIHDFAEPIFFTWFWEYDYQQANPLRFYPSDYSKNNLIEYYPEYLRYWTMNSREQLLRGVKTFSEGVGSLLNVNLLIGHTLLADQSPAGKMSLLRITDQGLIEKELIDAGWLNGDMNNGTYYIELDGTRHIFTYEDFNIRKMESVPVP